ncbi:iron-containing alcohol dehydrogenase [Haloarculaceae archaeon H-GB2-1]|nr:iron-containing alcohol dehydrogenase [Haloarculaceae archaeon H-GB2-1]
MTQDLHMWNVPNRVLFGHGAAAETGDYLESFGAERALIVTDEGVRGAGVLDPVTDAIEDAGKDYAIFDGVVPDPTDTVVHEAAETYDEADADMLIGIGGGSSMDTAKAASILATNDGHILDYEGAGNVENDTPPTIYMPTTSGSGSEVGNWCIVRDSETDIKEEIGDVKLLADLALVDPQLTASAPAPVKAATGMDVLTHAVEAFVSIKAQSQTSALALDSIEKVGEYLPVPSSTAAATTRPSGRWLAPPPKPGWPSTARDSEPSTPSPTRSAGSSACPTVSSTPSCSRTSWSTTSRKCPRSSSPSPRHWARTSTTTHPRVARRTRPSARPANSATASASPRRWPTPTPSATPSLNSQRTPWTTAV